MQYKPNVRVSLLQFFVCVAHSQLLVLVCTVECNTALMVVRQNIAEMVKKHFFWYKLVIDALSDSDLCCSVVSNSLCISFSFSQC